MTLLEISLSVAIVLLIAALLYIYLKIIPSLKQQNIECDDSSSSEIEALKLRINDLEKSIRESHLNEYKAYAAKLLNLIKSIPDFSKKAPGEQQNSQMLEFMNNVLGLLPNHQAYKSGYEDYNLKIRTGIEAYSLILKLNNFMDEARQKFQSQDTPLTDLQVKENMDTILNIAMIAFDSITSFHNINKTDGQDINIDLLANKISTSEALAKAHIMTGNSTETPKWIRVIKETLERHNIREANVIFSGYKQ